MVTRTVQQYARSGVAALHIEDQVQTKRCGHLQGKQIVDTPTFISRIRAAKAACDSIDSSIVIIARTDALQSLGYNASIERLKAAQRAGADVAFLEGVTSKDEARAVVRDLAPFPVLLNMVEHGATPSISVAEAQYMGFRIIIFPFAGLAPAYKAIRAVYSKLKIEGVTGAEADMTPKQLFAVSGLQESLDIDAAAGGVAFAGGV
jgi:2-methylisocitrate lyase-like PEP mutase family enzyme